MARSGWWRRAPRALLAPIGATGAIVASTVVAATAGAAGFILAWLLVGLVAGYALSGSV